MPRSRRDFLTKSSLSLMGAAMAAKTASAKQTPSTPGAPPAFGTSAPVGPAVSVETFQEAQKLVQVEMTPHDLAQAAGNWQQSMASVYERRTGPRKLAIEDTISPATVWNPLLSAPVAASGTGVLPKRLYHLPGLPEKEEDIAFAPVSLLSQWIKAKQITSERLTGIYIKRLREFDPKLHCVITLTEEHALQQARAADAEIAAAFTRNGRPWPVRLKPALSYAAT